MPTDLVSPGPDAHQENLEKVDHIVVLMMENRSFDHMLGYLSLEGGRGDVDGLTGEESNSHKGKSYGPRHLEQTRFPQSHDPGHTGAAVARQLADNNGGFVAEYAERVGGEDAPLVMGYYNAGDLPIYDHLAREFAVCDRWFASVPGATWPNRLYAMTGGADGSHDNRKPVPFYDRVAFTRYLDAVEPAASWRWYSFDPALLRMVDEEYRPFGHDENFAPFDKRSPFERKNFLDDAREGRLPSVAWIDPNFVDFNVFLGPPGSNDDHPPSDVMAGQELVLRLYEALRQSPQWSKTMLVITYDEHGGFYDHVPPPEALDDDPAFRRYGPRVPALVVSPFVEPEAVAATDVDGTPVKTVFDHASIIKTILVRFCQQPDGRIPNMGKRVTEANHLGGLLTRADPRPGPPLPDEAEVARRMAGWRSEAFELKAPPEAAPQGLAPTELDEFSEGVLRASEALRSGGLRPGRP